MVPNIPTVLQRFTGDWAMLRQPAATLTVCHEIGSTADSQTINEATLRNQSGSCVRRRQSDGLEPTGAMGTD